jgi:hypothetical protein
MFKVNKKIKDLKKQIDRVENRVYVNGTTLVTIDTKLDRISRESALNEIASLSYRLDLLDEKFECLEKYLQICLETVPENSEYRKVPSTTNTAYKDGHLGPY